MPRISGEEPGPTSCRQHPVPFAPGDTFLPTPCLERDGTWVGSINRHTTTRGRRGWRARLATGIDVPAYGTLAITATSNLWRSRDLAAAAIAQRLDQVSG